MRQLSLETDIPEEVQRPKAPGPIVLSVSDLNKAIRGKLEGEFPLIWLKGEISNFKPHTSGHWYYSLKDSKAQISAVMFRGFNQTVKFRPADGMEVLVRGKITVYEPRGNYQIFCELMEPVGAGAMQIAFEQLKAKLQAEGLFDKAKKRPLPKLPQHVVVVTSPTGAAIRDILQVLNRRFKGLRVTVVPAVVQGKQAAASICAAITLANKLTDADVMIIGRGGGSMEDMWCFNEESVARAIAASKVPTISAVGHEIDFTIADFVADLRAPTPSAAAELVIKSTAELHDRIESLKSQMSQCMGHRLSVLSRQISNLQRHLVDPKKRLADLSQRCDELQSRFTLAMTRYFEMKGQKIELLQHRMRSPAETINRLKHQVGESFLRMESRMRLHLERCRAKFTQAAAVLDNLSPLKVLDRGYAIASSQGQVLRDPKQVKPGDELKVQVAKGEIRTQVLETTESK